MRLKNIIAEHVEYFRDNPNHYWFKRKLYGWGWTPVTWQGWITIIFFVALAYLNFLRIDRVSHSGSDSLINFIPQTFVLVAVLLIICYKKGEKSRWQWGVPSKDK